MCDRGSLHHQCFDLQYGSHWDFLLLTLAFTKILNVDMQLLQARLGQKGPSGLLSSHNHCDGFEFLQRAMCHLPNAISRAGFHTTFHNLRDRQPATDNAAHWAHRAGMRGLDRVLHFHSLQHHQRLASVHMVAHRADYIPHVGCECGCYLCTTDLIPARSQPFTCAVSSLRKVQADQ